MLRLAVVFLVVALIAALLGFGVVADLAWSGFYIFAVIFVVLAVIAFLAGGFRSPPV